MDRKFTYFAFISYSHRDTRWAEWIHQALEGYRLPSSVRKDVGRQLPRRIAPVFRDATDLSVGRLTDNLHRELDESNFLIVVCSPYSARPNAEGKHYVNDEVSYFCRNHDADHVIPVIVAGTPEESFCEVIKESDLLALDATKISKSRLLNDIVARILSLRPDVLWKREERRRRVRRLCLLLCGLTFGLFMSAGLFYWRDSCRDYVCHYDDFVEIYGLPQGLWRLTDDEIRHRRHSYRFLFRGYSRSDFGLATGRVSPWGLGALGVRRVLRSVAVVNSQGVVQEVDSISEVDDKTPVREFAYDNGGCLRAVRKRDAVGRELGRLNYLRDDNGGLNCVMKYGGVSSLKTDFMGRRCADPRNPGQTYVAKSDVAQMLLIRDAAGRVIGERYFNLFGSPAMDSDGCYGREFELDGLGRPVGWWHVDEKGNRHSARNAVAECRKRYEGRNAVFVEYFDDRGEPIIGTYGWCARRDSFDRYGNHVRSVYIGPDGKVMYDREGIAGFERTYDEYGNLTRTCYLDSKGRPCMSYGGEAGSAATFDAKGRCLESWQIDANGNPRLQYGGLVKTRFDYDERGRVVRETRFGLAGNLLMSCDVAAFVECRYSADGHIVSLRRRSADRNLWAGPDGVAGWDSEFDKEGNNVHQVFVGRDGKPVLFDEKGYAEARYTYDAQGNMTSFSVFDVHARPAIHRDGYSSVKISYDSCGREIGRDWLDAEGKPVACFRKDADAVGFAASRFGYDERGNRTTVRYYDEHGALRRAANGCSGWNSTYDRRGNEIRRVFVGPDGSETVMRPIGVSALEKEYDSYGHCIVDRMLGEDGKPVVNPELGCSEIRYSFGNRGQLLTTAYFDAAGRPVRGKKEGYAKEVREYDAYGRVVRNSYWDETGHSVMQGTGYASMTVEYSDRGEMRKASFYDEAGCPVMASLKPGEVKFATIEIEFDDTGHCSRVVLRDIGGKELQREGSNSAKKE